MHSFYRFSSVRWRMSGRVWTESWSCWPRPCIAKFICSCTAPTISFSATFQLRLPRLHAKKKRRLFIYFSFHNTWMHTFHKDLSIFWVNAQEDRTWTCILCIFDIFSIYWQILSFLRSIPKQQASKLSRFLCETFAFSTSETVSIGSGNSLLHAVGNVCVGRIWLIAWSGLIHVLNQVHYNPEDIP